MTQDHLCSAVSILLAVHANSLAFKCRCVVSFSQAFWQKAWLVALQTVLMSSVHAHSWRRYRCKPKSQTPGEFNCDVLMSMACFWCTVFVHLPSHLQSMQSVHISPVWESRHDLVDVTERLEVGSGLLCAHGGSGRSGCCAVSSNTHDTCAAGNARNRGHGLSAGPG